jgi:tetratricopeptide (TPR) repeat protein
MAADHVRLRLVRAQARLEEIPGGVYIVCWCDYVQADGGDSDEAAANFSKALEVDPAYAPAHANLGSLQEQQGKIDEAIASYSNTLKFMADNTMSAQTHFRLGKLLARTGKRSEAIEHYRESLTLKPDYAPAQQALKGIPTETNQSSPNR